MHNLHFAQFGDVLFSHFMRWGILFKLLTSFSFFVSRITRRSASCHTTGNLSLILWAPCCPYFMATWYTKPNRVRTISHYNRVFLKYVYTMIKLHNWSIRLSLSLPLYLSHTNVHTHMHICKSADFPSHHDNVPREFCVNGYFHSIVIGPQEMLHCGWVLAVNCLPVLKAIPLVKWTLIHYSYFTTE